MIIFDFDQTLVDTSSLENLRSHRRWSEVRRRAGFLDPYPGVTDLLGELRDRNQKLAIVTTSPNMVAEDFVQKYNWPVETVIGYHQVNRRIKPRPDGLLLALSHCGEAPDGSSHVGDKPEDTEASRNAGVLAIGAGWGSKDIALLKASEPDRLFMAVADLRTFFMDVLG